MAPIGPDQRLPVVGVMGSGTHAHERRARAVGQWLAREGVHLLTGGGGGVMAAVSEAFFKVSNRKGAVIGIIPGDAPPGYPNPWVEIPIYTHLPFSGSKGAELLSRNHINILSSAAVIALPGSAGTASEVVLATKYHRPVAAFIERPEEIPGLPHHVMVTDDLERIKRWVRSILATHRR